MSIRASEYARATLEVDVELSTTARLVFMLLAERANSRTGETYTGGWLSAAVGTAHRSTLWRAIGELTAAGYISVRHRPGKARAVRFPVVSMLSTPDAQARRVESADPLHSRDVPVAQPRQPRRVTATRTGYVPAMYPAASLCERGGCECDGTGWVHVEALDGGRGHVEPCSGRNAPKAVSE